MNLLRQRKRIPTAQQPFLLSVPRGIGGLSNFIFIVVSVRRVVIFGSLDENGTAKRRLERIPPGAPERMKIPTTDRNGTWLMNALLIESASI